MRNFIKHTLFPSLNMKLTLVQRALVSLYFSSVAVAIAAPFLLAGLLIYITADVLKQM